MRSHTGTYGTPPVTRTDSGSGQLIVPPHRVLYTRSCVKLCQTSKRKSTSKLVGQVIEGVKSPSQADGLANWDFAWGSVSGTYNILIYSLLTIDSMLISIRL